jgi:thioredoxin-related protein
MRKLFFYIALLFASTIMASDVHWAKDFKSGIEQATKENKPVLFVFSRHTCKYCVILDETTFSDKRVVKGLDRDFVSIVSYSDENDYTPRELWRPGTPTIWFLMPDGEPMFKPLMGAVDPDGFLKAIAIVKKEFDKRESLKKTNIKSEKK